MIINSIIAGAGGANVIVTETGTTTIQNATSDITISHNLGRIPQFALIYVDIADYGDIPAGSCVQCCYQYADYANSSAYDSNPMKYMYWYKHSTSLNLLGGNSTLLTNQYSSTQFHFIRGKENWKPLDNNGNPINYRWVVGYIND